MTRDRARAALGDWQTPEPLAREVVALLAARGLAPRTVLEPTCGEGAFLAAARAAFPRAVLVGYDLSEAHLAACRARVGDAARLARRDFFGVDWAAELSTLEAPVLILGNPPWVTNAALGALGATNLPSKRNAGARGIDALTGASNFDVSEWIAACLLDAGIATGAPFAIALLVKRAVARKIARRALASALPVRGSTHAFDARRAFGVAVDAALLLVERDAPAREWLEHASLDDRAPARWIVARGRLVRETDALEATAHLEGASRYTWRSGLKHDCARVMELSPEAAARLEPRFVFPLLKGTDVACGRLVPGRAVVVPQRMVGEDTAAIAEAAPRTWAHLEANAEALDARKSRVYRGRPRFSIFGVGPYAFAPWKVAISGLHKRLTFAVIAPHEGRPVMLDDTCYFVACEAEAEARALRDALESPQARAFLEARVDWDAKRPIQKSLLARLRVEELIGPAAST